MNKHTPGPWEVAYQDKNGQAVVKAEHIEVATCWHHSVGAIEEEMHANACLIAAAPDLLKALKVGLRQNEHDMMMTGEECRQCWAAIAKAEGV